MTAEPTSPARILIWDLPTRILHWSLVLLVPFSWWTAQNDMMDRHRLSGYAILGLLLFRLIWGFAGSDTARFAGFVRGPGTVWNYARTLAARPSPPATIGHNPLGGWAVLALLAALVGQVGLGLFAIDVDGIESGPLAQYVSFDTGRLAAETHEFLFLVLAGLIALHILAVALHYGLFLHDLIGPMIFGHGESAQPGAAPMAAPGWRFPAAALLSFALAWLISRGLRV